MGEQADRWIAGWRGLALAGLVAVLAGLPGLLALPALDRDEARFAQATAQMIEGGDFTAIRFQERLREGASPGAHWLQAASVRGLSRVEAREIWAWRIPSLLGMALAAMACAWGASAMFPPGSGVWAGVILGGSFLGSSLAGMATADALFVGASALAFSAFARLYAAGRSEQAAAWRHKALFWAGVILAALVKGPLILALGLIFGATLIAADRDAPWLKTLGWGWGLIALAAIAGPWVVAVTVATDGRFWSVLAEGGGPIGAKTLAAPLMLFPAAGLLVLAAPFAWRRREEAGVRLALAWLAPAWLVFELTPGRAVYETAPLYIALAWLAAAAWTAQSAAGGRARLTGAALSVISGGALAALALWASTQFGGAASTVVVAALFLAAGALVAFAILRGRSALLAWGMATGIAAHGVLTGHVLPAQDALWPSREALRALADNGLDPRDGLAIGPVATAGYSEPSLVFSLGADTETGAAQDAVRAIAQGRPALIEAAEEAAFQREAAARRVRLHAVTVIKGYSWTKGGPVQLTLYRRRPA